MRLGEDGRTVRSFWTGLVLALTLAGQVSAQGTVQQSGPVVPFHAGTFFGNGVLADAGTPFKPYLNDVGLFNGANCPFGISSQTTPGTSLVPYSQFSICQTLTTTTLSFTGANGQSAPGVFFNVGGTNYAFPGPGNGDVLGPPSAISGHVACYNSSSGTLLSDCGQALPLYSGTNTWTGAQTFDNAIILGGSISATPITGGSIDNAVIGGITPAAATFTTLNTTGVISASSAASGSSSVGVNQNLVNITSDTESITGPNFLDGFTVQLSSGGSLLRGGRQALYSLLNWTAASNAANANRNYVSGTFGINLTAGDGGTNTGSGSQGAFFGINPVAIAQSGATNLLELTGGEVNWGAMTGSSMEFKFGLSLVELADQVHGAVGDGDLLIGAQAGAAGASVGIQFSNINGQYPLSSTGTLIDAGTGTVAQGLSTISATVTGAVIQMATGQKIALDSSHSLSSASLNVSGPITAGTILRPGQAIFSNLATINPSPQVGDEVVITDASACTANTQITSGGGTTHSCAAVYNGAGYIAIVTH